MVLRSAILLVAVTAFVTCSGGFAQVVSMDGKLNARQGPRSVKDEVDSTFSGSRTQSEQPSAPGMVTVHELAHKVPWKALKEYERAARAQDKGDHEKAIEHLKKAVAIDPEFTEAANNLGVAYLHTNHVDLAINQFNKVIAIDPHGTLANSNLAVAFLMQKHFIEAERAARHQLELERAGTLPRFLLGLALLGQKKYTPEAEQNLTRAAVDFPDAHLQLARLLAAKGEIQPAKDQLTRYLASGDQSEMDLANDWLRRLNSLPHAAQ